MCHRPIVGFDRDAIHDEPLERDADHRLDARRAAQQLVVVSPPPSDATAAPIEAQTGRQDDVDRCGVDLGSVDQRLKESEGVALQPVAVCVE